MVGLRHPHHRRREHGSEPGVVRQHQQRGRRSSRRHRPRRDSAEDGHQRPDRRQLPHVRLQVPLRGVPGLRRHCQYNDAFIAELDNSTWTTSGSAISAPNNFAFDSSNNVVSINSTGLGGMSARRRGRHSVRWHSRRQGLGARRCGGATGLLHASTQVTRGRALGLLLDLRPGRQPVRLGRLPRQPRGWIRAQPGRQLRTGSDARQLQAQPDPGDSD